MKLPEQLAQLQQQIATEKQRGAEHDKFLVGQWEVQEAALLEQIMNEQQQQREQAIEEKVQEDIAFFISGVHVSEIPAEWLPVFEMIIKADRRKIYAEHALELELIKDEGAAYKAEAELKISNQDKALEALRQDYETCARELQEQTAETLRVIDERYDYKHKLANAVIQLEEKDAEIARLNDQISDYQKAKVFGEREAQSIIDVNADEANDINKAIAKAKETWADKANRGLGRWDLPPITLPAIEEVQPFRDEHAIATEPDGNQLPAAETVETVESQFPELGLAVQPSGEEAQVVSKVEFDSLREEVMQRIFDLEAQVFGPDRVVA